jgi:hypothetical protein
MAAGHGSDLVKLISMRLPAAAVGGATLMAWRAYSISPSSSFVETDMAGWMMLGAFLLVVMLIWELVRSYLRLNERHAVPRCET